MNVQEIVKEILLGNLTNEDLNKVSEAVVFARAQIAKQNKFTLRAGSRVKFNSARVGREVIGTVEKVNRKYIIVRDSQTMGCWRVPANMLIPA